MTIRYKTTDIGKAIEYMRIHLRDKYFVSGYKLGVEYIVQVSGLEEVKYEPKDEKICETCRYWQYIAYEWQCEATKCQGYKPKTEQTEREGE